MVCAGTGKHSNAVQNASCTKCSIQAIQLYTCICGSRTQVALRSRSQLGLFNLCSKLGLALVQQTISRSGIPTIRNGIHLRPHTAHSSNTDAITVALIQCD